MNRSIKLLLVSIICMAAAFASAQKILRGHILSISEVEKKWTPQAFDEAKFKKANAADRAKMAADLIKRNPYKGKTSVDVRNSLGSWDGFYHFDIFPAYLIGAEEENWQLVFILDRHNKVDRVVVHENGTPASWLNR